MQKKELLKIKHPAQSWQENTEIHGGKNGANSTETNKRKQDKQKEVDPTKMGKTWLYNVCISIYLSIHPSVAETKITTYYYISQNPEH